MHLAFDFPKVSPDAPPYKQLEYYRLFHGFSKEELGEMIGLPAMEIANYEKQFQEIYYEQAIKLSNVLGIDVDILLDDYTRFVMPGYGNRIKEIRSCLGLSQSALSKQIGVGRCTLSIWEIEYHRPSRENYLKLLAIRKGNERLTIKSQAQK